jgi:hypothetical protein
MDIPRYSVLSTGLKRRNIATFLCLMFDLERKMPSTRTFVAGWAHAATPATMAAVH